MDQNTAFTEFWHILEDTEDLLTEGYRMPHPAPPSFHVPVVRDQDDSELHPLRQEQIRETGGEIETCRSCDLHVARKNAVVGQGAVKARLMVVLPPPNYDGDDNQVPIFGEAREFLNKWIQAVGLDPDKDCYYTNVVKCRPPGNRPPFPEELKSCRHFLQDQVDTIRPSILLLLGSSSLTLLGLTIQDFNRHRGQPLEGPAPLVLCTYDPFWVMEHPEFKRPVWEDLKLIKDFIQHGS